MDNRHPREAWKHLGKELERRRGQFGYGFRQRGGFLRDRGGTMSEKTLARLERGERDSYPDASVAAFEALYGWEPGSIETVLSGGEPALSPGTPGAPAPADDRPDLVRDNWGNPDVQKIWGLSVSAPQRTAMITVYLMNQAGEVPDFLRRAVRAQAEDEGRRGRNGGSRSA